MTEGQGEGADRSAGGRARASRDNAIGVQIFRRRASPAGHFGFGRISAGREPGQKRAAT